jgi:thymidylate synthase (FAD)
MAKIESLDGIFPEEWINFDIPEDREEIIGHTIPYLDHGFVQVVNVMGSDRTISEGARASFRGEAYDDDKRNAGLIRYLMEHQHTSPVELPVVEFRTRIPLFVRAQHIRHRTQSCNWESHRYSEVEQEFYTPPLERIRLQDKWNKQGSGDKLEADLRQEIQDSMVRRHEEQIGIYQAMIERGVSRETARGILSTSFYSTGVWTMKLRNLFHYLKLRTDPHAQAEIQLLAGICERLTAKLFPMAYDAWLEYDKKAVTFSNAEMEHLKWFLEMSDFEHCMSFNHDEINGSERRLKDFLSKVRKDG